MSLRTCHRRCCPWVRSIKDGCCMGGTTWSWLVLSSESTCASRVPAPLSTMTYNVPPLLSVQFVHTPQALDSAAVLLLSLSHAAVLTVYISCLSCVRRAHNLWRGQLASSPSPPSSAVGEDAPLPSAPVRLQEAAKASLDGGVLDAKWSQRPLEDSSGAAVLACATSSGRLVLYALSTMGACEEETEAAEFRILASSDAGPRLLLSLDWSGGGMEDAKVRRGAETGSPSCVVFSVRSP